jgi:hypothetical protein
VRQGLLRAVHIIEVAPWCRRLRERDDVFVSFGLFVLFRLPQWKEVSAFTRICGPVMSRRSSGAYRLAAR